MKIKDEAVKNLICNSYMNGMRIKELQSILVNQYDLKISDRTLYRFLTKNCPSRWAITHQKNED